MQETCSTFYHIVNYWGKIALGMMMDWAVHKQCSKVPTIFGLLPRRYGHGWKMLMQLVVTILNTDNVLCLVAVACTVSLNLGKSALKLNAEEQFTMS